MAIVGAAVWVTVDNSIWDKSEYANSAINKVKQSLPEATEILKDVCFLLLILVKEYVILSLFLLII